jgi:hypothetical protein
MFCNSLNHPHGCKMSEPAFSTLQNSSTSKLNALGFYLKWPPSASVGIGGCVSLQPPNSDTHVAEKLPQL